MPTRSIFCSHGDAASGELATRDNVPMLPHFKMQMFAVAILILHPISAGFGQQSDREAFDKAVAALEAKECAMAVRTLEGISGSVTKDPAFILTSAKAYECVGKLEDALELYRQYLKLAPDTPEIRQAVGRVLFNLEKQNEAKDARNKKIGAQRGQCMNACDREIINCRATVDWNTTERRSCLLSGGDRYQCERSYPRRPTDEDCTRGIDQCRSGCDSRFKLED